MQKGFFLGCLVLLHTVVQAQSSFGTITGKVLDKATGQAMAFVYVALPQKGMGTLTNEQGEFAFRYPLINKDDNLVASHIGYENVSKKIADFGTGDTLWVEATPPIQLDTAFTHHIDPKKMVADALQRVKLNCQSNSFMLNGFYRETLWRDSAFVKITEAALKVEKNPTPPAKIPDDFMAEKVKMLRGRSYEKSELSADLAEFGFGNGPALVSHSMEIALPEYLDGKNFDDYTYELDSLLSGFQGRPVFVFRFSPSSKKLKAAREGKIYVDTTSRAIVRIEYDFTPDGLKDVVKGSFKNVFGGMKTDVKRVSAHYQYLPFNGKWYLQDSQLRLEANLKRGKDFQAFAALHLVFLTNEIALKFNPAIRPAEHLQSTENFPKGGSRYDDTLWGNFNYLKPTAQMREIVKRPTAAKK